MRCYESHGETAQLSLQSDLGLSINHQVDLLERRSQDTQDLASRQASLRTAPKQDQEALIISPWKIATFKVTKTTGNSEFGIPNCLT